MSNRERLYLRFPQPLATNENTNRLLRQYFPKGTELARYAQADIDRMALRVNQRPRKTFALQTPMETLQTNVAMTGRTQGRFFKIFSPSSGPYFPL